MLTSTSSAMATMRRLITSTVTGSSVSASGRRAAARMSTAAVNVDLSELADREAVARADQGARSVLHDQRRACSGEAGAQAGAIIDAGVEEGILLEEEHRVVGDVRHAGAMSGIGEAGDVGPLHLPGSERMQRHDLDIGSRVGVAIAVQVFGIEQLAQCRRVDIRRQRDLDRMVLALVAQLGLAREADAARAELAQERSLTLGFELGVECERARHRGVVEPD